MGEAGAEPDYYSGKKCPKFHVRELVLGEPKLGEEASCSGKMLTN